MSQDVHGRANPPYASVEGALPNDRLWDKANIAPALMRLGLSGALVILAVLIESFRPQFYYAATPYLYPLFYIFAAVFLGLGCGLVTSFFSLVIIGQWVEPADGLGWGSTLVHCLQAGWLGLQARRTQPMQVFTEGLKFWLWCGTPLLCVIALPYFQEFFWSGATIVLQELTTNLFVLALFSVCFYGQSIRKRLAALNRRQDLSGKHSLRYSAELGAGGLVIIASTLFFVSDRIIDHDAGNSLFSEATRIYGSLHNYRTQDRALAIHYRVAAAIEASTGDVRDLKQPIAEILKSFPAVCASVFRLRKANSQTIVPTSDCASDQVKLAVELLSKPTVAQEFLPQLDAPEQPSVWPAVLSPENYVLVTFVETDSISFKAREGGLQLSKGPVVRNQLGMEAMSQADYLSKIQIGPLDNPWTKNNAEYIKIPENEGKHFFSDRLSEVFHYEFPARFGPDLNVTGLKISFPANEFAKVQFREAGVFLSIVVAVLLILLFFIRSRVASEITAIEHYGAQLEAYPAQPTDSLTHPEPETAEVDNLGQNISHLLKSLDAAHTEQAATLLSLESRARQLSGMVEQSRAFLLILTQKGELVTENKIAKSKDAAPLRQAVISAVKAHSRGEDPDDDSPITRAALTWLQSGAANYFTEAKLAAVDSDEPKTYTLQFGTIEGPETTYSARIEDISDLIATKEQLAHTSRLAELGELATGVAHELNQPLNAILMTASNIGVNLEREELTDSYLSGKLDRIEGQVRRASNIVNDLKSFARAEKLEKSAVPVSSIINHAVELIAAQFELDNVEIVTVDEAADLKVLANPQQIEQVLLNLFNNARHVMQKQGGGTLTVTASRKGKRASVTVRDTGPGIDPKLRDKIFTPFFTTKMSQGGTGLGLSISYRLIRDHGGDLRLLDSGPGATFEILLPLHTG